MRKGSLCVFAAAFLWMIVSVHVNANPAQNPGCAEKSAKQCVDVALEAMGGRERLQQVKNVRLQNIGHTLLVEQSYRQAPFITSYERDQTTVDLVNQRIRMEEKMTWPESNANKADSELLLIVGREGGVYHSKKGDSPCSLGNLDAAHEMLNLGPERLLLAASDAADLHFEAPETLRATSHVVVAFTKEKIPVRVLLNSFNHLPDAVETTQQFRDFWYYWGDVKQRVYFDNWELVQGITYPTNRITERNGVIWNSKQSLNVEFNVAIDEKDFEMDPQAAKQSAASPGWNFPFHLAKDVTLAPGVTLFPGAWNSTIVKQADGIVIRKRRFLACTRRE